jgi:hypothetical protein
VTLTDGRVGATKRIPKAQRQVPEARGQGTKTVEVGQESQQGANAGHASDEAARQAAWKALAEVDAARAGEGPAIEMDGGEVLDGVGWYQKRDLMLAAKSSHQSRKRPCRICATGEEMPGINPRQIRVRCG